MKIKEFFIKLFTRHVKLKLLAMAFSFVLVILINAV